MNYPAPSYGVPAVAAGTSMSTTKIIIIVVVVAVVGIVIFLCVVGLALGLGLGLGLRQPDTTPSKLSVPIVNCDSVPATCGCPITRPYSSRIINGDTAAASSWPWMVYLTVNGTKYCSGFLVTLQHVITAASCVANAGTNITVNIGTNQYPAGIVANVSKVNFTTDSLDSTIAIITLGTNLTSGSAVKPCCLTADMSEPSVFERGVIAGWGETAVGTLGLPYSSLQQGVIQVVNPSNCGLGGTSGSQFCASYDSIATCPIDVGGPFMVSRNNLWTCVGIVIGGTTTCNNPISFTRLGYYQSFIRSITNITAFT